MNPRILRAKARVTISEMAHRMRIPPSELRDLESTSVELWEVGTLRTYVTALGYSLRIDVEHARFNDRDSDLTALLWKTIK